jgi:SAM-dependent methyltransferase
MTAILEPSRCAVCCREDDAREVYPANFTPDAFDARTFSARRLPDRVHYRIVRCNRCGLVRSDPVAQPEVLASLYRESSFDYASEVANLVRTYSPYLVRASSWREPSAYLEIGCGSGFMLEEALRIGFSSVTGVEPSSEAVRRAAPKVRQSILCDVLRPGLLEKDRFDVACMFQVLDHLPDPGAALSLCRDALKPGGHLLVLNHNVRALSSRALGRLSPIIDVEHTYLYDPATLATLCRNQGFLVETSGPVHNWCSLGYLAQLLPIPEATKRAMAQGLERLNLAPLSVLLPLGNLFLIARKPQA